MNAEQNSFFQMLAAVKATVDPFKSVWAHTPSFVLPYRQLQSNVLDRVTDAVVQQDQTSTSATAGKKVLRQALEAHLQSLAATVEAYAVSIADRSLALDAHVTKTDVRQATDDALLGLERRISLLAAGHLKALAPFGVTRARIATLDADAAAFAAAVGTPRAAQAARKEGTEALEALVDLGRHYLDAMDAQMVLFEERDPSFCSQYLTARKLVAPPRRPHALFIAAREAGGESLPGVVVHIDGLDLTKVTSAKGACYIRNAVPGSYPVLAQKHGYKPLKTVAYVNAGETAHLDLILTPEEG